MLLRRQEHELDALEIARKEALRPHEEASRASPHLGDRTATGWSRRQGGTRFPALDRHRTRYASARRRRDTGARRPPRPPATATLARRVSRDANTCPSVGEQDSAEQPDDENGRGIRGDGLVDRKGGDVEKSRDRDAHRGGPDGDDDGQRYQQVRQRIGRHRRVVLIRLRHVRKDAQDRGDERNVEELAGAPETRHDDAVHAHQHHAFRHLQERHEVVILRVVVQPTEAEPAQVVAEDGVLDEDLAYVVVMKGEIGHLEPEREDIHRQHGEECLAADVVEPDPPVAEHALHGRIEQRFHKCRTMRQRTPAAQHSRRQPRRLVHCSETAITWPGASASPRTC